MLPRLARAARHCDAALRDVRDLRGKVDTRSGSNLRFYLAKRMRALMRAWVAAALLGIGQYAAPAQALTCKAFNGRFAAAVRSARPPLAPLVLSEGKQTTTTPHMAYTLAGEDGLTGNIECFERDSLHEVDFYLDLNSVPTAGLPARIKRLRATATAAVCAIGAPACTQAMADLFARMDRQLSRATSQRDPLPSANETTTLSDGMILDASARPGAMQFSVFLRTASRTE